ncbi:lonely Cys domain-containing protein [Streptomyces tauricus]|uniref:lonely Cys domain-containing protein n=1 Tax=Streptomyces tauricus TaxID=68274 RepID=UPI003423912B
MVLVSPNAGAGGLDLPRRAAARAGRTLWSHSGEVGMKPDPDTGRHHIQVTDNLDLEVAATGEWIGSKPGDLGPADGRTGTGEGVLETADGRTLKDEEIRNFTLTDGGWPVGRAVLSGADQMERESYLRALIRSTEWNSYDPVTGKAVGPPRPVPWKGLKPYFYIGHGLPGQTVMVEDEPERGAVVRGPETGGFLRRRASVARLDRKTPIVFLSCWGSEREGNNAVPELWSRTFVPDPLGVLSAAQGVSNVTRREVYAPNRMHTTVEKGGRLLHHGITTTPVNDPVDMEKLRPEPTPDELDALAGQAGLETSSDFTPAMARDTALRLVRALRITFGVDVENDKDDPAGTYRRLLRGIGALEVMRRGDENLRGYGELTLDLLDRVTRAHHGLTTVPGTRAVSPDPADVRTMLEAAAARRPAARSPRPPHPPYPHLPHPPHRPLHGPRCATSSPCPPWTGPAF